MLRESFSVVESPCIQFRNPNFVGEHGIAMKAIPRSGNACIEKRRTDMMLFPHVSPESSRNPYSSRGQAIADRCHVNYATYKSGQLSQS